MHKLFKIALKNVFYSAAWIKDYMYVVHWQLKSAPRLWPRRPFKVVGNGTPVLLIPGIYENWRFMQPLIGTLQQSGYQVHVVTKLGYNRNSIEEMTGLVIDYITEHKLTGLDIVAHSKGGLIAKYVLMQRPAVINKVIAINTPFNGSLYARFFVIKEVRVFSKNSVLLQRLTQAREVNDRIVSMYSRFDPHIPDGSRLGGATNIVFNKVGHFSPIADPDVQRTVLDQLNG
jgi:pimeloyl-ACP methyl ester carboxylesterase